ncbi:MAG: acetate kinase [Thermoanaerobaculaceae bacterium]|jgi:acetate kinase|nr:acetate kinase [Thermoanaerobaculaceae bacterium]
MKILVLNSGSSSIKFQLMDTADRKVLCKGLIERIGLADAIFNYEKAGCPKTREVRPILDHTTGIKLILDALVHPECGVLASLDEIAAAGHRIVHGGERIKQSVLLCDETLRLIDECTPLAPLHNPANLMGVHAMQALLPTIPNVGVFDTAFHATMPRYAYMYALEYSYYEKHGIRRFGFHGTSHQYVAMRGAEILGKPPAEFNCVTCHLGNGVSLTAVKGGRSMDTTLGFGTVCGVPMGTRSGDVDPAALMHLIDELGMTSRQVCDLIYKGSGLKGISGLTNDMRDIEQAAAAGHERAELALEIFAHAARKYIAALATSLEDRVDAVIFTAGIGENGAEIRERICKGLGFMGVHLDPARNTVRGKEAIVSTDDSPVKVMVVPTNEELMIALDTEAIVKASRA